MPKLIDITGLRFGSLVAVRHVTRAGHTKMWVCVCDCGQEKEISGSNLRAGATASCGCQTSARKSAAKRTHGLRATRLYSIWASVKTRCTNPRSNGFARYGARGISLFPEWANNFASFAAGVGDPPSDRHTLDRIDNNQGYFPGNIRWATSSEQARNGSRNVWVTIGDDTKCLTDWAASMGMSFAGLWYRYRKGLWPK